MATADLVVMGGGIFGLAIGWECARRGAHVQVIEARHVGAGASGGVLGALAPHVPENWNPKKQFQFESLIMAESFWAEVQAASGIDPGYARIGRLQPLADAAAVAQAQRRAAGAGQFWLGKADWQVTADADPAWAGSSPSGLWLFDTLSARIAPRRALLALAAAIRAKGGRVDELHGATAPEIAPQTPVIWATGVNGLVDLSQSLAQEVGNGVKGQAALFSCPSAGKAQLFTDALHIVPHSDGTVAVGSTSERHYTDPTSTDAGLDDLIAKARQLCPALQDAPVIEGWASLRPRAKSRAPMLGIWPGRPGQYVANGGFKIGLGMAPKVAQVMANLVLDGQDATPDGFRIEDNL